MPAQPWFHFETIQALSAAAKPSARIKIFGIIGGSWLSDGVTAKQFLHELELAGDVGGIEVLLDSPGGSVSDGLTIYDALRNHPAKVTTNVIGVAASMASVLMLAGDVRQIAENGRVMVHRATGSVNGTHEEMTRYAEILKQNEDRIVEIYTARTAQTEKAMRTMMNTMVGTWLFGQQAVDKGFATQVTKGVKATAFHQEWAAFFDVLPAALFDTAASTDPANHIPDILAMKPEEIQKLITDGIKAGLTDHAASQKDTIGKIVAESLKTEITAAIKTPLDEAMKPITDRLGKVEAFGEEMKKLTDRVEKAEGLVKAGITAAAGGTKPAEGGEGDDDGKDKAPTNEAELKAALAKCKNFSERRQILNAYDERNA